jgi:20S proteasome subunit alpha 7
VIPTKTLAERVASYMHQHTLFGWMRPFGSAVLVGGWDASQQYQMFSLDPAGNSFGYSGAALGKAASSARNELEKLQFETLTAKEAVVEVAKIIYRVHDEIKDKDFELELSWITETTQHIHERVPQDVYTAAVKAAKDALNEDFDSE